MSCLFCQLRKLSIYIDPLQLVEPLFNIVKSIPFEEPQYLIEPSIESSMLFDNCPDSKIFIIPTDQFKLYLMAIPIESLDLKKHSHIMGHVQGPWAGTIYENEIIKPKSEYNFVFLGRHRIILNRNSELALYIRGHYQEGKIFTIANILNKLYEAKNRHLDETFFSEIGIVL
ncbi:MAG: hypothetical protein APF81_26455 [Desulfosporosinus sp. BRH_c37]|nr:MAG: hypothetical protein APF81_26455 [Desulfosporosinus sp. BRH_c37]